MPSDIRFQDEDLILEAGGAVRVRGNLEGAGARFSGLGVVRLQTQMLFVDADRLGSLPNLPELPRPARPTSGASRPQPMPSNPEQAVLFADGLVDIIGYIHLLHRQIASLHERVRELEGAS